MKHERTHDPANELRNGAVHDRSADFSTEVGTPANGMLTALNEELEQLRDGSRERDQFLDLLRLTRADFEHFQKRVEREREQEGRYQHRALILDLLPVLDDLERALAAAEQAGNDGPLASGVDLVRTMFLNVLRWHGITPVNALGREFDPNLHCALATKSIPGQPANTVVEVIKEGYRIHDRLLRPAKVIVAIPPDQLS